MKKSLGIATAVLPLLAPTGCGTNGGADGPCFALADCRDGLLCVSETAETGPGECKPDVSDDPGSVYTDSATDLEWQTRPTGGDMDWESAVAHCENLKLDGSGWRLPSIGELRSLIRSCPATQPGGPCRITDTCLSFDSCETAECEGCDTGAGPASGCYWADEFGDSCSRFYWSSSTIDEVSDRVFYIIFDFAHMSARTKTFFFGTVRCVR